MARMLDVGAWRGGRGVGMDALRALRLLVTSAIKDAEPAGGIWLMVTCVAKYRSRCCGRGEQVSIHGIGVL